MDRRRFLTSLAAAGALYGAGGLPVLGSLARADGFAPVSQRFLVNVFLEGGPDMRHLLAPAFDADPASFGYRFWQAMAPAHELGDSASDWEARWNRDYTHRVAGADEFGILSRCGWLTRMWDAGKVAIVCNVYGSRQRNHVLARQVMDQGRLDLGILDTEGPGWGGRLAVAGNGNVAALTRSPSRFCMSPDADDPSVGVTERVIGAANTREMALFQPDPDFSGPAERSITRAVSSYYAAKRQEMPHTSVFRRFVDQEASIRAFGDPIAERLDGVPLPASITALYQGDKNLASGYFGQQIRNLHDAIACNDILSLRAASLEYLGFDTHDNQRAELEPALEDLFGDGKALDVLHGELPQDARDNMVMVLAGEFGRQIRANGGAGTDHGEGTVVLLIGERVAGGVYGELYPEAELARLGDASPQIDGLTSLEHVFGAACEWVQPGSADIVFPGRAGAPLESGVSLDGLLG